MSPGPLSVRRLLVFALVALTAIYLFQLVRPLHLESDSVCYLHFAEIGAEGRGFHCPGCDRTHCSILYPPGYPWTLSVLIRAGIATPQAFVLLNLGCLAAGLVAAAGIWRRSMGLQGTVSLGLVALFLLWWPVFRLVNTPISDFVFFAVALLSVLAATTSMTANGARSLGMWLLSALLALAAFKIRTVGIALAPALLWALLAQAERWAWLRAQLANRAVALGLAIALLAMGVMAALVLRRSQYFTVDLRTQYGHGLGATLKRSWGYRLTEFGELAMNMPAGKLPAVAQPVVYLTGAACVLLLLWLLWRRRWSWSPAEVFAAGVAGIMSIWPFEDARFWLPVMPILLGLAAWALLPMMARPGLRRLVGAGLTVFVLLGLLGQAYNTRITLMGDRFATAFTDDYLGPVYRAAWGVPLPTDTLPVDSTAFHVLRRFEPRARPRQ